MGKTVLKKNLIGIRNNMETNLQFVFSDITEMFGEL